MAPKKPLPPPPFASPEPKEEEEEEETSGEESEGGESEVKENGYTTPIQSSQLKNKPGVQRQTTLPPPAPHSSGSEEEEEGSDSEEEEEEEGNVGISNGYVKESEKDDSVMDDVSDDEGDFRSKYPYLSQSFDVDGFSFIPDSTISSVRMNLGLIDSVKARELEEKWKKIRQLEVENYLKRLNLMREQIELVLDSQKKRRRVN